MSNHETQALGDKQAIVLVGPSGVGKSAISRHLCEMNPEFSAPTGFTTRAPRPDDAPGSYRYLSHEQVEELAADDVVQQVTHLDGNVYGTLVEDYPSPVSVIDAMSSSIGDFEKAGFGRIAIFGIIASSPLLLDRLEKRYPSDHPSRHARLTEALLCLLWLEDHPDVTLIVNDAATNEPAARQVMQLFSGQDEATASRTKPQAHELRNNIVDISKALNLQPVS